MEKLWRRRRRRMEDKELSQRESLSLLTEKNEPVSHLNKNSVLFNMSSEPHGVT